MKSLLLSLLVTTALADDWVREQPEAGAFPLVHEGHAAVVITSPEDFKVVHLAARDLVADIERVTGLRPEPADHSRGPAILIGTLGHSPLIDDLVAARKLKLSELQGAWESFIITTVANPLPGVTSALVIAGSDRRGTAFGVYELSQAIGVSPWYWWADVTPERKSALYVAAGTRRFGPPSVQYRGIFINDEDWGLQPWAAKTFEPEAGGIGPKTYAKVCELLLRLKANTLWPAMHPSTKAFNSFPQNKQVADDYAIVMGSSHAEPMLRNNVGEWTAPKEEYDYVHNRAGVLSYWEQRVKENGRFENIYTLGMRGIHDSNMVGPKTDAERIATLEQIFTDQRELIKKYARPSASGSQLSSLNSQLTSIPQMFCAYKEVLALYRQGLKVPDDVTIVWPDDNFGYIRNFASPEELKRSGGFGVYYHLSYLGAPLSYLWLCTTPPALIWEEMNKAYDHGARKIWIANVGDIKPAEVDIEFFLQMAWDIKRWNAGNLADYLPQWTTHAFGALNAADIARVMDEYYRLNFARRPEHLQWWLRKGTPQPSPLSRAEIDDRLAAFARLRVESEWIARRLPATKRDAFEELVGYPVRGSELANQRYFYGELGWKDRALAADAGLKEATRRYNEENAGGKWRGMTSLEPADHQFQSMRIYPWQMPEFQPQPAPSQPIAKIPAGSALVTTGHNDRTWTPVHGIGEMVSPTTRPSLDPAKLVDEAPSLLYEVNIPSPGDYTVEARLLPTFPVAPGHGLRVAIGLDEAPPQVIAYESKDGSAEWEQGVLNNYVTAKVTWTVSTAGKHKLFLYGLDPGVVVRELLIK